MHPVIEKYYNVIKNLRSCAPFIKEINECNDLLDNFDYMRAVQVINKYALKYQVDINNIAKLNSARPIVTSKNIMEELYSKKDDDDVIDDVKYIRDCIIIISSCVCGACSDLSTFVKEMNRYDLYN